MDRELIKGLIEELLRCEGMLLVIDSGGAVSEMHAQPEIVTEFDGRWATIEAGEWHVHLDLDEGAGGAVRGELQPRARVDDAQAVLHAAVGGC